VICHDDRVAVESSDDGKPGEISSGSAVAPSPGSGGWPDLPAPLPVAVPDSHCHLNINYRQRERPSEESGFSVSQALAHARSVGVTRVVQVGYDLESSRWGVDIALRHHEVIAAVALHPNEAPKLAASGTFDDAFDEITKLVSDPRVRAVGETGLDYFRTPPEGRDAQEQSFRRHIALAKSSGRALIIHDRDAHDDVVRVLLGEGAPDRVVFHCFSGDAELAQVCAKHGWFMSFAGQVTFKANEHLRDALRVAPAELLLVETDAPFLTPLPFRGRPNAPYLIPVTLRAMADVRGVDVSELATTASAATERAFGVW
jgi:TatD DNase family protein